MVRRNTIRPIRPNPLIPMRHVIALPPYDTLHTCVCDDTLVHMWSMSALVGSVCSTISGVFHYHVLREKQSACHLPRGDARTGPARTHSCRTMVLAGVGCDEATVTREADSDNLSRPHTARAHVVAAGEASSARRVDGDPIGHQRRSNHQCGAVGGQHHTPQGTRPCPLERGAVRYRKD